MSPGRTSSSGIVDPRGEILEPGEHDARPSRLEQCRRGGGALENGALGREAAAQRDEAADGRHRIVEGTDHFSVDPTRRLVEPLGERAPFHVDRVEVQQRPQLPQQRPHAAGGMEILHVALADGLQVDQHRRLVRDLVEALQRDLDAEPPRDGREMHDRVGGAADRHEHPDRVLDRLLGDYLRGVIFVSMRRTAALPVSSPRPAGRHARPESPRCRATTCRASRRCRPSSTRCP